MKHYDYQKSEKYTQLGMQSSYYLFHVSEQAAHIIEHRICQYRQPSGRYQYILSEAQKLHLDTELATGV